LGALLSAPGDPAIRQRISDLLGRGEAIWCPVIRLELWNGVGSEADRKILQDFEASMPELAITEEVWDEACELADRGRKARKTAPAIDLIIAACTSHYRVRLEHTASHFDFLLTL
jgi:predicted nucleic acid-binding protein